MTSERECYVYIVLPGATSFVTAGRFQTSAVDGVAIGRFVYGRAYRERADAVELDPVELRLAAGVFETGRMEGFFGAIRDAMPDYWGRLALERQLGGPLGEFDYLLHGPDDRAGALGFGLELATANAGRPFPPARQLAALQRHAEAVLAGNTGPPSQQEGDALFGSTSMGGARPKAVVEDDSALWLAKFSRSDDRWNQPRVEAGMLALAAECGLNAAQGRLRTVGDKDVLLVRRFDRERAEHGYRRARMVSALTLLRADDSVTARGQWAYPLLADEIRRASAAPRSDLRELFARMCFNAAVSNLDDHPRNHALIAWEGGWRLSPAYDLVPSPVLAQERRDLAMVCGKFGRFANRENLVSASGRFLLSTEDAGGIFDQVLQTVYTRWRPVFRQAGVTSNDCDAVAGAFAYAGLTSRLPIDWRR